MKQVIIFVAAWMLLGALASFTRYVPIPDGYGQAEVSEDYSRIMLWDRWTHRVCVRLVENTSGRAATLVFGPAMETTYICT